MLNENMSDNCVMCARISIKLCFYSLFWFVTRA